MKRSLQSTLLLLLFIVGLLLAPLLLPEFYVTLLNYIGLYAIVALGLVMLTGVGGLTSFGQAAFVGLGAYTSAYLTTVHGVSPWLTLPAGLLVTGVVALSLGLVTLRLSGHFLPLGTIAWGMSLYYLFGNLDALGGHTGMSGGATPDGSGAQVVLSTVRMNAIRAVDPLNNTLTCEAMSRGRRPLQMGHSNELG